MSVETEWATERLDQLLLRTWASHSDLIALEDEEVVLTYRDLTRRALTMATALRVRGVGPGSRVAVHLERSADLVIALAGTVLAGAAHVALDVADPVERLRFMLDDTAPAVLISTRTMADRLGTSCSLVEVPRDAGAPAERIDLPGDGTQVCYLVYTSGSTGRPKASLIPHRALVSRLRWLQRRYRLATDDRVLYNTACGFDVSVAELYWPLVSGARLVVARQGAQRDADYLAETIKRRRVTTLHFVPSLLEMFLVARDPAERYDGVRRVLAGGEALSPTLVRRWNARSTGTLHNMYGPSECAIYSTAWECPRNPDPDPVLIGSAVEDTVLLVLDEQRQRVPVGVPGELYIGGVGLAIGYHGRPDLTAERFVHVPGEQERFYRSGDLVREIGSGDLQYLGRTDRQLKIRGFRIELGEVEAVGAEMPSVARIAVVPTPEPVRLVAGVVLADPSADPVQVIRDLHGRLSARLPAYMLPTATIVLDALPVTANGKLDSGVLLDRARAQLEGSGDIDSPPCGALELAIAGIWCEILGLAAVGRDDDVFEIGGDSLAAVKIVRRMRRQLGVPVPIRLIFEEHTVAGLAAHLAAGGSS